MNRLLISWVGKADLHAPKEEQSVGKGPIAQTLSTASYDTAVLVSDYPKEVVAPFLNWLRPQTEAAMTVHYEAVI